MIRSVIGWLRASTGPGGGRQRDGTAHPGRTGAAQDVIVELRAEVSHSARQRERRQALVIAEGALHDVVRQVDKELRIGGPRPASDDAIADLEESPRADPAGDRLAARLVRAETGEETGKVHDAGSIIGDDHAARPDVGAGSA